MARRTTPGAGQAGVAHPARSGDTDLGCRPTPTPHHGNPATRLEDRSHRPRLAKWVPSRPAAGPRPPPLSSPRFTTHPGAVQSPLSSIQATCQQQAATAGDFQQVLPPRRARVDSDGDGPHAGAGGGSGVGAGGQGGHARSASPIAQERRGLVGDGGPGLRGPAKRVRAGLGLRRSGLAWPCPSPAHPTHGTRTLGQGCRVRMNRGGAEDGARARAARRNRDAQYDETPAMGPRMRRASCKSLGTGRGWGLGGGPGAVSGGARCCRADGGGSAPRCGAAAARVGAAPPKNAIRRHSHPPPPPTPSPVRPPPSPAQPHATDRDALGVDCAQVGVLKQVHNEILGGLRVGFEGRGWKAA